MYIKALSITNLRCFKTAHLAFQFPGRVQSGEAPPVARLPNVNLLLGDNGAGKSTILKGIAMALNGPILPHAGFRPYSLVRRVFEKGATGGRPRAAQVKADVELAAQDGLTRNAGKARQLFVKIGRLRDTDVLNETTKPSGVWRSMFQDNSPAFLVLGYGATRRIGDPREISARAKETHVRLQRVEGLFREGYGLIPLSWWLPNYPNKGRRSQVIKLLNQLLGEQYTFAGEYENGEFIFQQGGARVPLTAMSDGYRAFVGWVSDMLYHICKGAPSGAKLIENHGVVMVDEIDLHLHPEWQRTVIQTLAHTFPNIQFIFTSHSPLVTGSLEWPNIYVMRPDGPQQIAAPIHGLSADQVLLSPFFNLESTRAPEMTQRLRDLENKAQKGSTEAAMEIMQHLATGMEADAYSIEQTGTARPNGNRRGLRKR